MEWNAAFMAKKMSRFTMLQTVAHYQNNTYLLSAKSAQSEGQGISILAIINGC